MKLLNYFLPDVDIFIVLEIAVALNDGVCRY